MGQVLTDFGIQPVLLAAQVVNFLILLILLKKFLYKPLLKVLEQRKEKIAQSLKQAEEIEQRLQKTEEDREKTLTYAGREAQQILADATDSAKSIIAEAHLKAKRDIEVIISKNNQLLSLEREKIEQEIKEELADLVAAGLKLVAGKVLTEKDKKELIEKSLKEMN